MASWVGRAFVGAKGAAWTEIADRATKPAQVAMMMRTVNPSLALQRDALAEAGCGRIFTEQLSGGVADRPALRDTLEFERSGDALILWKLDRLARSVKQLIETIEELRVRGSGFRKPDRSSRHDDGAGPACFSHVCRVGGIRTQPDPGAHPSGPCRRTARWSHGRPSAETDGRRHRGPTPTSRRASKNVSLREDSASCGAVGRGLWIA
jgi:Resolvase, N terminal domain